MGGWGCECHGACRVLICLHGYSFLFGGGGEVAYVCHGVHQLDVSALWLVAVRGIGGGGCVWHGVHQLDIIKLT